MRHLCCLVIWMGVELGVWVAAGGPVPAPCQTHQLSPAAEHRKEFLDCYKPSFGPSPNATKVAVKVVLGDSKITVMDGPSTTIRIYGRLYIWWKNLWFRRSIQLLRYSGEEMWTPELASLDTLANFLVPSNVFIVGYESVMFNEADITGNCDSDASNWPFDTLNCTISFVNINPSLYELEFENISELVPMHRSASKDWHPIAAFSPTLSSIGHAEIVELTLVLQRNSRKLLACLVYPCIVLAAFVLLSFWYPADRQERLLIMCMSLLMQLFFIKYAMLNFDLMTNQVPGALLLYRDITLLTAFALVQWVWSWHLRQGEVPALLNSVIKFLDTPSGTILTCVLVMPSCPKSKGSTLSMLTDRVTFFIIFFCLLILIARLYPWMFYSPLSIDHF